MSKDDESDLTEFEIWAISKGYDITISMLSTKENVVTFGDPRTLAAYDGWNAGFVKGLHLSRLLKTK